MFKNKNKSSKAKPSTGLVGYRKVLEEKRIAREQAEARRSRKSTPTSEQNKE